MMFQDFRGSVSARGRTQAPESHALEQAAELIARYPNLSEIELARLINLYRELSALDMAMMISDTDLAPRLDCFYKEHRRCLRMPFREYSVLVYIAIAGIIIATWAVVLGA